MVDSTRLKAPAGLVRPAHLGKGLLLRHMAQRIAPGGFPPPDPAGAKGAQAGLDQGEFQEDARLLSLESFLFDQPA